MLRYALPFLLIFPSAALADSIDGTWCNGEAGHVAIEGPKISLNGKTAFDGKYSRHEFSYTVPTGEDHAGEQVYMRLLDDEDMVSATLKDGQGFDPIQWKRCSVTS